MIRITPNSLASSLPKVGIMGIHGNVQKNWKSRQSCFTWVSFFKSPLKSDILRIDKSDFSNMFFFYRNFQVWNIPMNHTPLPVDFPSGLWECGVGCHRLWPITVGGAWDEGRTTRVFPQSHAELAPKSQLSFFKWMDGNRGH